MTMTLLLAVTLIDDQLQKIAWDCGQYELLPDEDACMMWLEDQLQTVFADHPLPPDQMRIRKEPK